MISPLPSAKNNPHTKVAQLGEACSEPSSRILKFPEKFQLPDVGSIDLLCSYRLPILEPSDLGPHCSHVTRAAGWQNLALKGHFCRSKMDFIHLCHNLDRFCCGCLCMKVSWGISRILRFSPFSMSLHIDNRHFIRRDIRLTVFLHSFWNISTVYLYTDTT